MRCVSTSDLKEKEVINLCSGEKLGFPTDFEIDLEDCRIRSMYVSKSCGLSFFEKPEEYLIPWCKIECIGEDAILVKLHESELCGGNSSCQSKKKGRTRK